MRRKEAGLDRRAVELAKELLERWTGFGLPEEIPSRVLDAFERRAGALGYGETRDYLEALRNAPSRGEEVQLLVNMITNGLTAFWREEPQLLALKEILKELSQKKGGEAVRVWCAGVSTGEEAYTVAMVAAEAKIPVEVLGTDVNTNFLATAREGVFSSWSLRRLSPDRRRRFLREVGKEKWKVSHRAFESVEFRWHNLLSPAPTSSARDGRWEVILCRNVLIYFSESSRAQALRFIWEGLGPRGYLMLGSSEQVHQEGVEGEALGLSPIRQGGGFLYRVRGPEEGGKEAPGADLGLAEVGLAEVGLEERTSEAGEEALGAALWAQAKMYLLEEGEQELAMACLEAALGYDPFRVEGHCVMGALLSSLGAEGEALASFQKALFLDPNHWYGAYRMATLHELRGEKEEARVGYRQCLRSLGRGEDSMRGQMLLKALIGDVEALAHLARRRAEDFLQLQRLNGEE